MTTAILTRPGSISPLAEKSARSPWSPAGVNDAGLSFNRRIRSCRLSLDAKERMDSPSPGGKPNPLRRVSSLSSEADLITSTPTSPCSSRRFPNALLIEVEKDDDIAAVTEGVFSGGGNGNGAKTVTGSGGGGRDSGGRSLQNYYLEMLKVDPGNPLILRNYGRFLHEVEGDLKKAEEYYSRAILSNPGDGELLSLFGRLIWESQRDCQRAEDYYDRAVAASPNDCYVLGSYAHFLWDAEEEDDEQEERRLNPSPPLIEAI